ncbi:putative nuclease HARBI1 [Acyrthosiphon pisum]|uniref:DDE Tnp4 domain-containing protein n=1 Tax=Acyrthosiphon pisum TaxID=7029 RepID=A0A8R2HB66_ACYPI|nr:putative nuclease HARBI1 [Acyrthosiphon pisum]|eukprot:XP_016663902.1 PREDICTED: putative nuclease HARBI1 [Acyrthosiphon pisum]
MNLYVKIPLDKIKQSINKIELTHIDEYLTRDQRKHVAQFYTGNCAIAPIDKLLLTLRFYATGSFLITAGDFLGVSKSSACVIVRTVSTAIARLCHQFIYMPTTDEEVYTLQRSFYKIARFPRAIGAIDCTHIRIQSPGGHNAEYFRNRKGYFSLNVQTVVSPDLKIMDIVARWPGSCHDQTIFRNSNIHSQLVNGKWGNSLIVADSGYKNTSHIVTPFINPRGNIEELYNESIIRTRNPVERTYGVLKRRFPILSLGLRLKLTTSQTILYLSFLRPVLTFACETWSTTKGDEEKMACFERRVLRRIYGPILENEVYRRRTNVEVQQIYQKPGINAYLMSKRIEWAGHVWRSNGILKKALEGKINVKRPRGRPRQRWIDRVKEDINKCAQGLTLEDSIDRDSWKKVVEAAKVLQGQ